MSKHDIYNNSFHNSKTYYFKKFRNIKFTYNLKRIGIIPYVKENRKIYFCMGLDKRHKELTDFGGFKIKSDTSILDTANRELKEETNNLFDMYKLSNNPQYIFNNSISIIKGIYCTVFVNFTSLINEIGFSDNTTNKLFLEESRNKEISKCIWVPSYTFLYLIQYNNENNDKKISYTDYYNDTTVQYPRLYEKIRIMLRVLNINDFY